MLRARERGAITLECAAGRATAGFVYAPYALGAAPFEGTDRLEERYLRHGYPMEALRLRAATAWRRKPATWRIALRAGFPRPLMW